MTTLAEARALGLCQQCRCKPPILGRSRCEGCTKKQKDARARRAKNPKWRAKNAKRVLDWQKANPRRKLEKDARRRQRLKKEVFDHYGRKCSCCGEPCIQFLTIDHIEGGGTKHRKVVGRSSADFHNWLIKNGFPTGFQVLCFNCNCAKGIYGKCPHEEEQCSSPQTNFSVTP